MRTQVVIIGGGPSGLLLGQLLYKAGVETVVLERQTRSHVLGRIRAGVLERGLVELMGQAGADARMKAEGFVHDGTLIAYNSDMFRVDFATHTDATVLVYGQTELTRDLYDARDAVDGETYFQVEDVEIHDVNTDAPFVTFHQHGKGHHIKCDFVAGCDGFHGVSRKTIPANARREYEKVYPFGWLGVLSKTPPVNDELIYANSDRGFALCSMRNANLSRYYIQCETSDDPAHWTDDAFWEELRRRIPPQAAEALITGPSIEKSIAPLRSFVCEPMQWGRLFLCGDAAHIVPPTGAKGLNTAASDVHYLNQGLRQFYDQGETAGIDRYSERALARVWKTQRFSWWFSTLMHHFPGQTQFDKKMQLAELALLGDSHEAQAAMALGYVGLPY
ncbi:MAG: 4-hydroxybenzoate 3-monooxygenase [Pseudomonadota bacterium]